MYDKFFDWAFEIGMTIRCEGKKEPSKRGEDLLRRLIFSIRAEQTPGRFLEKLSETITEYKTNRNIGLDVEMHPEFFNQSWSADRFYYLKSSIISGFLNALGRR
ncbi:MAG: hypothetical protein QXQ11_07675 [Candidatus Bathyarchaeia archaeon]